MAKTFKRIAALATAIALVVCFAVSVAAEPVVTTTTAYVTGSNETKVNVTVNVSNADAEYVTYYATNNGVVYVDQVAVTNKTAQIKYQTDAVNLMGDVKVGYTGGSNAIPENIDAKVITLPNEKTKYLPTETTEAVIVFDYAPQTGYTVDQVTAVGATVDGTPDLSVTGKISVSLTNIGDAAEIKVSEKLAATHDAYGEFIDAAALVVKAGALGEATANEAEEGDRKLTVIGRAFNADEYGIVVYNGTLDAEYASIEELEADGDVYEALANYENAEGDLKGLFAVQIIDQAANDSADVTIKANTDYQVAVYVLDAGTVKVYGDKTVNAQ